MELREIKMSDEEKANALKFYLKDFAIYYNDEEENIFKEKIKSLKNYIIYSKDFNLLRKCICYILLNSNRMNYYYVHTNDIIEKMLNIDDEYINQNCNYRDLCDIQTLIIYHPRLYKKNKIMWETLNHLISIRKNYNKVTIIISDTNKFIDDNGKLEFDGEIITLKSKSIKNIDSNKSSNYSDSMNIKVF